MPVTNVDPNSDKVHGLADPAQYAAAVTTSDDDDLANSTRAIYVGGAGAVKVTTVGGDTVTFAAVPVGTTLWVRVKKIFATGTTATNLIALR